MDYTWYPAYHAALLETDKIRIRARLLIAEEKIVARLRVLAQDHGGAIEERLAIANALSGIKNLRTEVNDWSSKSGSTPNSA